MTAAGIQFKLRQSQKLEALGQMAAGVAHELSTPIQSLGDNLEFLHEAFHALLRCLEESPQDNAAAAGPLAPEVLRQEVPAALEQAREGVARVGEILRAIKTLAHPGSSTMVAADLNRVVDSALLLARSRTRYVARVDRESDPLPPVVCHPGLVNQVVLNLVLNAADAVAERHTNPAAGRIVVSTRSLGDWVEIGISDNGCGIPGDIAERVFDPFFTTKPVGQGSGQGLAIARTIVDEHGGTLSFATHPQGGTRFRVRLPVRPSLARGERRPA